MTHRGQLDFTVSDTAVSEAADLPWHNTTSAAAAAAAASSSTSATLDTESSPEAIVSNGHQDDIMCSMRAVSEQLAPLIDRFGRVLTDLSPHLHAFSRSQGAYANTAAAAAVASTTAPASVSAAGVVVGTETGTRTGTPDRASRRLSSNMTLAEMTADLSALRSRYCQSCVKHLLVVFNISNPLFIVVALLLLLLLLQAT